MPELRLYIGAKLIKAHGETKLDPDDILIEGYHVVYPDGYESWSPKKTFETAYRLVTDDEKELI